MTKDLLEPACQGFCTLCNVDHSLRMGEAHVHALALMQELETHKRIDFTVPAAQASPKFSTDYLWGEARGQMFGVLLYESPAGDTGILKAFSGQYNGEWLVEGWVPPLLDVDEFYRVSSDGEQAIKALTAKLDDLPDTPEFAAERKAIQQDRKARSQELQQSIHSLYKLPNFRGTTLAVPEAFVGEGIPTGTGDCCAPKLLGYASKHDLKPLGIAEFYWGKENRSGTRQHGQFYTACKEKCQPIMGHLLCGRRKFSK